MNKAALIIVAGGKGVRAGLPTPKQWELLHGKRVIDWSIDAGTQHAQIGQVIVVANEGLFPSDVTVVTGGNTRSQSVLNGLAAVAGGTDTIVLIHDAARPGLSQTMITQLLDKMSSADAVAPALPVPDALKRSDGKTLTHVNRDQLWRVQTPQAFRLGTIQTALESATEDLVDDLAALDSSHQKVELIAGDHRLQKITFPEDFDIMARLLAPLPSPPRVGKGFDVHAFEPGAHVTLCGLHIPHTAKLKGHSDADVGWHALTDAILGAAALGDIGDHFPPTDPQWGGTDSAVFLKAAVSLAKQAGFSVTSCDITIICEAPKVKPHREAMRASTAECMGLPINAVSVKATTTEGLGFTGREEGIAAEAIAVLIADA